MKKLTNNASKMQTLLPEPRVFLPFHGASLSEGANDELVNTKQYNDIGFPIYVHEIFPLASS